MADESEAINAGFFNTEMVQRRFDKAAKSSISRISKADKKDAKEIAAAQIELLTEFYNLSMSHANRSFRWALIASVVGLVFFMVAIYLQTQGEGAQANVALIGGALIEFIAGVNFYLYGRTLSQVNLNQGKLLALQRFLVANSLSETLGEEYKDPTRAQLIQQLAAYESATPLDFDLPGGGRGGSRRNRRERSRVEPDDSSDDDHPAASHS